MAQSTQSTESAQHLELPMDPAAGWPDLGAGDELVPDGGFEAANDGWHRVDWWKGADGARNRARFARIAEDAGFAQEIACEEYRGGSLQFIRPLPRIAGGSLVQVSLRLRGQANTRQIELALRQHGAPYATYARRKIDPSDAWMQHRFVLALPEKIAEDDLALVLTLTGPYCRAAVAAFPWIRDWEIWNEPDISFLQVPPGGDKVAIYAEICARTAAALTDEPVTLIGGVIAGHGDFMDRFLAAGGGASVDALSFHQYQVGQPALDERRHDLARWAAARNRRGEPLPVWHTEGSPFAVDSPTWLVSSGRRSRYGGGVLDAAAATVRPALWLLAQGVRRHVAYHTMSEAWGGYILRNQFGSLCDTDGSALPAIAAHAAMVALIEGATPAGVEERSIGGQRILLASFRRAGQRITAVWSEAGEVPLGDLATGATVLDGMAIPVPGRSPACCRSTC